MQKRPVAVFEQPATTNNVSNDRLAFLTAKQLNKSPKFVSALRKEEDMGIKDSWFYIKYEKRAQDMRLWMFKRLTDLHNRGHQIVAYGAAAKGMVLMHFLREVPGRNWEFDYVVDDAPLKQGTYCPGTTIPVRPTSALAEHNGSRPLTIVVFAWNFWDEIAGKITRSINEQALDQVYAIVPFPQQRFIKLNYTVGEQEVLQQNRFTMLPWPSVFPVLRKPVVLITHFFNEEWLLPWWIRHHAPMCDFAILIDYNSTDKSLDIIRREAPNTWQVVQSQNRMFGAVAVDREVEKYEALYPNAWKIALTLSEFLVHPNLRQSLADHNTTMAFRFRSFFMVGDDSAPLQRFTSLVKQRSRYASSSSNMLHGDTYASRFIHNHARLSYSPGRHSIPVPWEWSMVGFVAKFIYTPWPQIVNRQVQFSVRIPDSDSNHGMGNQHKLNRAQLRARHAIAVANKSADFAEFEAPSMEAAAASRLWKELV
eukprot:jgi/Chrzof1/2019/UNPLg00674.t1